MYSKQKSVLMKTILSAVLLVVLSQAVTPAAFASNVPNFTTCVNPKGEVKASYETGTHGIAGMPGNYSGKDAVYKISGEALTQCFCPEDGSGIQTNWWKIEGFTESEIKVYESKGWIYIPNGALWGLDNAPYFAKNSDYSCKGSGGNGNGGSGGNSDSGSSSGGSSTNSSGSGSSGSTGSGGIGQVLGLASTGNSVFVLGTALTSGLSLLIGLFLKKRAKSSSK